MRSILSSSKVNVTSEMLLKVSSWKSPTPAERSRLKFVHPPHGTNCASPVKILVHKYAQLTHVRMKTSRRPQSSIAIKITAADH